MAITEQTLIELFRKGTTAELNDAIAKLTEQVGKQQSERIYERALKAYDRETEESGTADFFERGKTYIEAKPFRAPEALRVFRCIDVAEHPAGHGMRAFGFMATAYPGDNWCSAVRQSRDWEQGWSEYDEPTANVHTCANCDGIDPDSCLFNPARGGAGA